MLADNTTPERLLDFANFVSDTPLSDLSEEVAFEPLIALLFSSQLAINGEIDSYYRVLIARYLISRGTPAIAPLIDYIIPDQEKASYGSSAEYHESREYRDDSCAKIAGLIGELGGETALSGLLEILQTTKRVSILRSTARAIVKLDTVDAINQLTEILLNHQNTYLRFVIAQAFGDSSQPGAVSALILSLKDTDTSVAVSAIRSLGKIKSDVALPFLLEVTTDFHLSGSTGGLLQSLAYVAIGAIQSYQTEQTKQIAFEWYVISLKDSDIETRYFAAYKLGTLQDNRAIPYLVEYLDDDSYYKLTGRYVSDMVKEALQEIGTPEALGTLKRWRPGLSISGGLKK